MVSLLGFSGASILWLMNVVSIDEPSKTDREAYYQYLDSIFRLGNTNLDGGYWGDSSFIAHDDDRGNQYSQSCERGIPLAGWPYREFRDVNAAFTQPVYGTINQSESLKVITLATYSDAFGLQHSATPGVYAFHADGAEMRDGDRDAETRGVFRIQAPDDGDRYRPIPLAQLDDDPAREVVFADHHSIQAFNGNGKKVDGAWPYRNGAREFRHFVDAAIMAANIDGELENGDRYDEIIFSDAFDETTDSQFLYVLKRDGTLLNGWPVELKQVNDFGRDIYALTVADFNKNVPGLEIVVAASPVYLQTWRGQIVPHKMVALSATGVKLWEQDVPDILDVVSADLDKDGQAEVLAAFRTNQNQAIADGYWSNRIRVYSGQTGQLLWEYKANLGPYISSILELPNGDIISTDSVAYPGGYGFQLLLGDLNDDQRVEAVWPTRFLVSRFIQYGQGGFEWRLLEDRGLIHAVTLRGRSLKNFPIQVGYDPALGETAVEVDALADVTGDGKVDIVASQRFGFRHENIRVWDHFGIENQGWWVELNPALPDYWYRLLPFQGALVGDVDQDGRVDITNPMMGGDLHIFNTCAAFHPQTMHWPMYRQNPGRTGFFKISN